MSDSKKRILIVEDEKDLRESLRDILNDREYDVSSVENTEFALGMLTELKPDLILLDILTGSLHGSLFIKRLQELGGDYAKIKIIVLTNIDQEQMRDKFHNMNVEAYMVKIDTSLQDVINKVEEVLS